MTAIGILHGDPTRGDSPYCPVTGAQVEASGLHYLALGHVHKGGAFRAGGTLCAWPGCPQGRGWDETGEKGLCIITLAEEAQLHTVSFDGPRFYDLEAEVDGNALQVLRQLLPAAQSRDFYRVTLTGTMSQELAQLLEAFPNVPHLRLRDRTLPAADLWTGAGEDTLEGVYFRLLRQAALEAEGRDRDQILLAAKISRRLLEGREVKLQ